MERVDRNKWQIRAVALLIFLLGFAAGALAPRAYQALRPTRADRFEQMLDRLRLNSEQRRQVEQIFGETRERLIGLRRESEPRVEEIRRQADDRLRQVLTPEQWQQFQQMKGEMRRRGRGPHGR